MVRGASRSHVSRALVVVSSACLVAGVVSCKGPADQAETGAKPEPELEPKPEPEPEPTQRCLANPEWVNDPSLPPEVGGAANCDFHQFMWQSFLYLVQPEQSTAKRPVFETWMPTYGIFVAQGQQPTPWGQPAPHACSNADDDSWLFSNIINQAGSGQPLIDQNSNDVYYGIAVDQGIYTMITQCDLYRSHCGGSVHPRGEGGEAIDLAKLYPNLALPDGGVELKTAWRVIVEGDPSAKNFYTTRGFVQDPQGTCKAVTLGLVGMHIVSKTPDNSALIWATFEHVSNSPDCTKLDAKPPVGDAWTFFDATRCDGCATNVYQPGVPTQVCRMHVWGDPTAGITPDGITCETDPNQHICKPAVRAQIRVNNVNLASINAAVAALVKLNPKIDDVWANYELVGNVWSTVDIKALASQYQDGSLASANTAMETYVQNGESGQTNPNNCFSCHNLDAKGPGAAPPPVAISHVFDELQPNTGGCKDGKLPQACAPYQG